MNVISYDITVAEMIEALSKMPQDSYLKVRQENGGLYNPAFPIMKKVDKDDMGDLVGAHNLKRGQEIVII
jgi:hypothetical protein